MIGSKLAACVGCVLLLGLVSCDTESCEREEPRIRFESFDYRVVALSDSLFIDSLIVEIWFEDCQGDIGIRPNEDGFNLHTFQYDLIDGEWSRVVPADSNATLAFFAKVPYSSETNEGNKLEGTVEQRFGSVRQRSDTIRFEMQLIDRAGNRSNRLVTPYQVLRDY